MDEQNKILANLVIARWVKDTTARQIVRYVMECELHERGIVKPSNQDLAKMFGWSLQTTEKAISLAKKSEFIATTGSRHGTTIGRVLELNLNHLRGKMAEEAIRSFRPKLEFKSVIN
jgi:DNA-binding transcriptional regulator YhcF (GntR family)